MSVCEHCKNYSPDEPCYCYCTMPESYEERVSTDRAKDYGCLFHCSECKSFMSAELNPLFKDKILYWNYCPVCGAKVVGE